MAHAVVQSDLPLGGRAVFQGCPRLGSVPNFEHLLVGEVVIKVEHLNGSHADAGVPHELERGLTPGSKLEGVEVVENGAGVFEFEHVVADEIAVVGAGELDEGVEVAVEELCFFAPFEEHPDGGEVVAEGGDEDAGLFAGGFELFEVVAGEVVDVVNVVFGTERLESF